MEEERTVWEGKPSQLVNLGQFATCLVLAWLVVPLIVAVRRFLHTHFTRYRVTSERLEVTTGVLSRRIDQVELYRVKDFIVQEPALLRMAGLGNLILRSSDRTHPVVVLQGIPECRLLREQLRGLVEKRRDEKRVRELDV